MQYSSIFISTNIPGSTDADDPGTILGKPLLLCKATRTVGNEGKLFLKLDMVI